MASRRAHPPSGLLPHPRLKRKAPASKAIPPSSQSGILTHIPRRKCYGVLCGQSAVIVRSPMHIQSLASRGCFGKGIFSRSTPTHGRLPPPPGEGRRKRHGNEEEVLEEFELAQTKRVELHKQWKKQKEEEKEVRRGTEGEKELQRKWLKEEEEEGEEEESSGCQERMPGKTEEQKWQEKKGVQGNSKAEESQQQKADKERGLLGDEQQQEVQPLECTTTAAATGHVHPILTSSPGFPAFFASQAGKPGGEASGHVHPTGTIYDEEGVTKSPLECTGMQIDSSSDSPTLPAQEVTVLSDERKRYDDFVDRIKALSDRDAYKVTEYLQLSSEEAFYLVQELGELTVSTPKEHQELGELTVPTARKEPHTYSPAELWSVFCGTDNRFIERYVAYRYFRQKGWVAKSGLKYGVDFLLYKDGPAKYHSSYAVTVKLDHPPSDVLHLEQISLPISSAEGDGQPVLTWQDVISYCRVSESVAKDLLVCYVTPPATLPSDPGMDWWRKSPECVTDFSVKEVLVKRWVPDRERSS